MSEPKMPPHTVTLTCDVCPIKFSFHNDQGGQLAIQYWNDHKANCSTTKDPESLLEKTSVEEAASALALFAEMSVIHAQSHRHSEERAESDLAPRRSTRSPVSSLKILSESARALSSSPEVEFPPSVGSARSVSPNAPSRSGRDELCDNCGTTSTPLWRKDPNTNKLLCNACGLYVKLHKRQRPHTAMNPRPSSPASVSHPSPITKVEGGAGEVLECVNCHTRNTGLWRRNILGEQLCNACGLYYKLHEAHRPAALFNNAFKPRSGTASWTSPRATSSPAVKQKHKQHHVPLVASYLVHDFGASHKFNRKPPISNHLTSLEGVLLRT